MSDVSDSISEMMQALPPHIQSEVIDFIEFLMGKYQRKPNRKLRQDWAGALSDHRDRYSSLDLQKQSLKWRGD